MLELPPTIRLPRPDELPNNPEVFERLKERDKANITEGYKLHYNTTHDLPFKYYAEININNTRLWDLFEALANEMPDELSCVYNLYEEAPIFSTYTSKFFILNKLANYKTELTQDCNLELGLIYHVDDKLEEVFICESKFLKVWGIDEVRFRHLMNKLELEEISNLNFVDEFPKVVEPLSIFLKDAKPPEVVVKELGIFFNNSSI